ncbi:glucuronyl esterase domain-containing protein [Puniceicoccus vermicola]|uniref:4-O-methyl-glucuronoyl methylesterase-like domain-containing protein n=1 Tax=Puniceicoccus vermicola TaxID=388746 RepID=A0A7X1AZN0_9BACT|nr:hypothetical protein [Puniceicoccus vermicola]MBC2601815.1 hypothetical protein [Puniceicoccus vermicola]
MKTSKRRFSASLAAAILTLQPAMAENLTWTGGNGTWDLGIYSEPYENGWPSGGSWTGSQIWNNGTAYWTNQSSGTITSTTGATGPGSGEDDTAVFSTAGGGIVNVADVTATRAEGLFAKMLSFEASGYALNTNAPEGALITLSNWTAINIEPSAQVSIGFGVEVVMNDSNSRISGGGILDVYGTLRQRSSGIFSINDDTTVNVEPGGNLGGDFYGNTIFVGRSGPAILNVNGGQVNIGNGSQNRSLILADASNSGGSEINLNDGQIKLLNYGSSRVEVGRSSLGSGTATFNLNGGVLQTPVLQSTGGNSTFRFNGGLLQIVPDATGVFSGIDSVLVSAGPARLSAGDNFGGYEVAYAEPLQHDPALGSTPDGGVIKQDFGTIIFANGNTYTGDTVVERGKLVLPEASLHTESGVHLGPNAVLDLDFNGINSVATLHINGEPQSPGTWGAEGSGATHISRHFAGSGLLDVDEVGDPQPPISFSKGPDVGRDYDPAVIASIPDPLTMNNGDPVSSTQKWTNERREEILELFRENVYGRNAVDRPPYLKHDVVYSSRIFNNTAIREKVLITYGDGNGNRDSFYLYVYRPIPGTTKPKGIFILINNRPSSYTYNAHTYSPGSGGYDFFPVKEILERGYVAAGFKNREVADDETTAFSDGEGVFSVFGPTGSMDSNRRYPTRPGDAWAAIGAWSWGASRAIDWIKSDPELQDIPVAVVGHSRGGKAALWCGAQDTRVDLAISNSSGSTGAAMARTKFGEDIDQINRNFPHWFSDNYKDFGDRETELPVDQHMLLALCAPRLVYVQSSYEDWSADPTAEYESCLRAGPVYDLFGLGIVDSRWRPGPNKPQHGGSIGYHARGDGYPGDDGTGGWHDMMPYDWNQYMDYADQHFPDFSTDLRQWREDHGLDRFGIDDEKTSDDGTPYIMKYALNLPEPGKSMNSSAPTMPFNGSAGLPAFISDGNEVFFQHVRRKTETEPGVEYRVERSPDLRSWEPIQTPTLVETVDSIWERVTFSGSLAPNSSSMFYRLRVTTP